VKNEINERTIDETTYCGQYLQDRCHSAASIAGWWDEFHALESGHKITWIGAKLMLCVTELAEAMEGNRKGLIDDKLPHRSMLEVELADTVIRCFDLAGGLGLDIGGAISEKLKFNETRADHKKENRAADGGKKI
jgi:NTP pyrophosphatase (non-canonical NTP hydrolase)